MGRSTPVIRTVANQSLDTWLPYTWSRARQIEWPDSIHPSKIAWNHLKSARPNHLDIKQYVQKSQEQSPNNSNPCLPFSFISSSMSSASRCLWNVSRRRLGDDICPSTRRTMQLKYRVISISYSLCGIIYWGEYQIFCVWKHLIVILSSDRSWGEENRQVNFVGVTF